jgi:hypothetical protein
MSNSEAAASQKAYEERVVNGLVPQLFETINVSVYPAQNKEFTRIFTKADFVETDWCQMVSPTSCKVECDFFGHVHKEVMTLPVLYNVKTNAGTFVTTSTITSPDTITSAEKNAPSGSPSKIDVPDAGNLWKYVVGEITCGGTRSVTGKADQLEKDCGIACLKLNEPRALSAVAFAIVVCPQDLAAEFFTHVRTNDSKFPKLFSLMAAGRLIFIQNLQTQTQVLKGMEQELHTLKADVAEITAKMATKADVTEMATKADIAQLMEMMQKLINK